MYIVSEIKVELDPNVPQTEDDVWEHGDNVTF